MNKRALMLTAATAALMSGPAFASCPSPAPNWTSITTQITVPVDTACANAGAPGTITITTSGSVVLSSSTTTTPAVTIDSGTVGAPNTVFNSGTISYNGITNAVGVELLANGNVGGLENIGSINLTGAGTTKTGVLIGLLSPATTGTFTGGVVPTVAISDLPSNFASDNIAIYLQSGSTVAVEGTGAYGIQSMGGTTLNGDIDIGGAITMTTAQTTQTTTTGNAAILLDGAMTGNLVILPGGSVSATGAGSEGIVVGTTTSGGGITGSIANYGFIETSGTSTPSSSTSVTNPEGGTALDIGANVTNGIYNAGPKATGDVTAAATMGTIGAAPTVVITTAIGAATAAPVTIGEYSDTTDSGYSFLNRGSISASAEQANVAQVIAISITGSSATPVTLNGGIFDSGSISATNSNDDSGTANSAIALLISGADIGSLLPANTAALMTNTLESGEGGITATVNGPFGGDATAVDLSTGTTLPIISNYGTIGATATTTETTIKSLGAEAIIDQSGANGPNVGTVTTINNFGTGTIEAFATPLENNAQIARAIDLTGSTQNVTITNNGTIVGDIVFGKGQNTLIDEGSGSTSATIGASLAQESTDYSAQTHVYFGGNLAGPDTLTIGASGTLTGSVFEGGDGTVNVDVAAGGTLNLQNSFIPLNAPTGFTPGATAAPLIANNFTIENNANWSLTLTQPFNLFGVNGNTSNLDTAIVVANTVSLGTAPTPNFQLYFSSFINSPASGTNPKGYAEFALIQAPIAAFNVTDQELLAMSSDIQVPFLFEGTGASALCTQNIAVSTIPCVAGTVLPAPTGQAQIDLLLQPKTAAQLDLSGYALKMFPYVNAALANDPQLGAAIVRAIDSNQTAQQYYASFAPDVSGATRATAISLTDSATDVVSARQRELRMYANQEGDTTLWGQEFAQRLSQSSTPDTIGYNDSGFGFAMGMDSGDPSDGRYGGAFTFFSGGSTTRDPVNQKTRSEFYLGTFYTDWRGRGLFLDSQLTAGWAHLSGERYIDPTDPTTGAVIVSRTADGGRPAAMLAGGLTTGAIFNFGSTVITPQISLDGLTMREDSYSETGGGDVNGGDGFDLHVQPYYANSARTFLGVDLRQDINFGDFYVQPQVRAGYRYDFLNGAVKLNANFVGITPISQFSIEGPDPEKGNIVLGGGMALTTGAWSIGVSYDYLRANSGNTQMDGMLTLLGRI